ncbi:hypothetical protein ACFLXE_04795 [Chloroflexota bacterium]
MTGVEEKQETLLIRTETPLAEIVYQQRVFNVYTVTDDELEHLSDIGTSTSTYVAFTMLCLGGFISFLVSVLTVDFQGSLKLPTFIAIVVVTAILSIFFGTMWHRSRRRGQQLKQSIKRMGG